MKWTPPDNEDYIDIFSNIPVNRETDSDQHDIITTCYCRGLTLADIGIPRLPHGIKSRDNSQKMSIKATLEALPARRGRGRAKMLEEREDHFKMIDRRRVEIMNCLDNLDTSSTIDSTSVNDGTSETSSLFGDCEFSDSDEVGDKPLSLPSERPAKLPDKPFVKPVARKRYDCNSVEDFPLLGSQDSDSASTFEVVPHRRKTKKKLKEISKVPAKRPPTKNAHSNSLKDTSNLLQNTKPVSQMNGAVPKSKTYDLSKNSTCMSNTNVATVKPNNIVKQTNVTDIEWKVKGSCVVQLEGLPLACDIAILEDTLSNFGQIEESEIQAVNGKYAIRYRFSTEDACEWVVSSLDDTDMLYPDCQSVLVCFKVQ